MSTRKHPNAIPEDPHPHVRLVWSIDEAIANAKAPDPVPVSPGYRIFRDWLRGLALAGTALHTSPESIATQSTILGSGLAQKRSRAGFLRRAKRWLFPSRLRELLGRNCALGSSFHDLDLMTPTTNSTTDNSRTNSCRKQEEECL
jgi:hypothetical protein